MAFQISPGVNVSEIDLTRVVPAVSTTEGGIAAHLRWGPTDKRVLIDSENALVNTFQTPDSNTAIDFFTAADFLSYGNALYVTRVINTVTTGETGRNAHAASANTIDTVIKNEDDYEDNYSSGISGVGDWVAKYPGELGNSLKVSVCPSANAWQSTLSGNLAYTANSSAVTGNNTLFDSEVTAGDIIVFGPDRELIKVASVESNTALTLASRYSGNTVTINTTHSSSRTRRWEHFLNFDQSPGTSAYATTRGGSGDELHVAVVDEDGEWTGTQNAILETFSKVSLASDAKKSDGSTNYYKEVVNQQSKYVWWARHNPANGQAGTKASTTFGGDGEPQTVSLIYGRDGSLPTNADKINGYNKFRDAADVDVSLLLGSGANQTIAVHLINNIAEVRKDCLVCLSPPKATVVNNSGYDSSEMDDVIAFRDTLPSTSYATMDSGWKYRYDKYNDLYRYTPLNGDVAGLMVRTDTSRDPWFSPAGFNRGNIKNVIRLPYVPREAQRDQLYKKGINPVVSFDGQGTILYGDKTLLNEPSAFDRINVRRLFIVLEKAISTASKFTLFEFNDEFTRAQFKNLVEPFLRDVKGRRGITDFRVVCDGSNNTGEVIDRNEFVGDIYIKPNRSINFIQLNFVAVRSGVAFEEIVGQF